MFCMYVFADVCKCQQFKAHLYSVCGILKSLFYFLSLDLFLSICKYICISIIKQLSYCFKFYTCYQFQISFVFLYYFHCFICAFLIFYKILFNLDILFCKILFIWCLFFVCFIYVYVTIDKLCLIVVLFLVHYFFNLNLKKNTLYLLSYNVFFSLTMF